MELCTSSVRRITLEIASMARLTAQRAETPRSPHQRQAPIIVEMDGSMLPLVASEGQGDRRKIRKCFWAETRAGTAQKLGDVDWKYSCSFGSTDDLGDQMRGLLQRMGWLESELFYSVGDGAKWITEQLERIAGPNFIFTVDLYHLCEYFSGAAEAWSACVPEEVRRLKDLSREGKIETVLHELRERVNLYPGHDGLCSCLRYIENRPGQFRYDEALRKGLPIGSGKIEGTHRHLVQKRLKLPGCWWKRENAEKILDLRVLRANGEWESLWQRSSLPPPSENAA